MPDHYEIARDQWARYSYMRDAGHRAFVEKATKCDDFFAGLQWDPSIVQELAAQKRPALTINKILITLSSIFGEQIDLRSETAFQPRFGAPPTNADILTKVFRCIADENQLNWKRSEVFGDGCVTSRGFFDVRLSFKHNVAGEVQINRLNPKSVLLDPSSGSYDPDDWNDVIVTSWVTPNDVELMFGKKREAEILKSRGGSIWDFGFDSMDLLFDTFGDSHVLVPDETNDKIANATQRNIRLIDRQHKVMVRMRYFVDPKTGDRMRVPDGWDEETIRFTAERGGLLLTYDVGKRIRWTVTAEEFVLHDDWSPFERFTIIPYFPALRSGKTVGVVESLLDPQELLNKTTSQELHIVNTMANSGWKVRSGSLTNMNVEDLEEQGAKTGLVIETNGEPDKDVVKIQPNQIPQGLDRLSFKAENYIKAISGRGDSQLGLDRADVSGKAINEKKESGHLNLRMALDNLERTDWLMARHILDIVQKFYTDPRIMNVTRGEITGEYDEISVNVPDPSTGEILNDLSLGTYNIVITSQNAKRTLEETEFAQALGLREIGIAIPDRFMIENSNLRGKQKIIAAMDAYEQSPEGQARKEAAILKQQLEVANLRAEASNKEANAVKDRAKAAESVNKMMQDDGQDEAEKARMEMQLAQEKHEQEMQFAREKHEQDMALQRAKEAEKRRTERLKAAVAAAQAARQPAKQPQGAKA